MRTWLANLVNDVMIEQAPTAYARSMAAVTPRKLWLAEEGDCVVTLAPCSPAMREYVASVTGVRMESIDVVAPAQLTPVHACTVIEALGATDTVVQRPELIPFVVDRLSVAFARKSGLRIPPYRPVPEPRTVAAIRRINTKDGFRRVASGLGLPIADGGYAATPEELTSALRRFLASHDAAIVKMNRSSNGSGTFVVTASDLSIGHGWTDATAPPQCGWVYEEFLPFDATPSVEMVVDESGPQEYYVCDQRTRDNAWTGMITPAPDRPHLIRAAIQIGKWLHDRGYRGYFDVDCGLVGDRFVVTEANVRRTGGTYLEQLARRLCSLVTPHWRSDARPGTRRLDFFGAVNALDRAGLADPHAEARAILLADTLDVDGKWRYLVVGRTADAAAAVENELVDLLRLT